MGFLLRVSDPDVNEATSGSAGSPVAVEIVEIETLNLPSSPIELRVQCEYESSNELDDDDDVLKMEQHGNRDENDHDDRLVQGGRKKKRKRGSGCDDRVPAAIQLKHTSSCPSNEPPPSSVLRVSDVISDSDDDDDSEGMSSSSSSDSSDDEEDDKHEDDEILSLQVKDAEEKSRSPLLPQQVPVPLQATVSKVPPQRPRGILKHRQHQRSCRPKNTKRARLQEREPKSVVFGNESTTTRYYPSTVTKVEINDKKSRLWCTKQDRMNSLQEVIDLMKIFRNENKVEIKKLVDLYRMLGGGGIDDVSPFLTKQTSDYLEHVNVTIPSLIRGMESRISPAFTSERRKNHIRNVLSLSNIRNLDAKERFVSNRSIQSSRSSRIVARMIGESDAKTKDITTAETFTPELVTVGDGSAAAAAVSRVPPPPPLPPTPILTSKKKKKRKKIAKKAQIKKNQKTKMRKTKKVLFPTQRHNHQSPKKKQNIGCGISSISTKIQSSSKKNTGALLTTATNQCSNSGKSLVSCGVASAKATTTSTKLVTPPLRTNLLGHARRRRIPIRPKRGE